MIEELTKRGTSAEVRRVAQQLAPQMADSFTWDEQGFIRFDFAEQMGSFNDVSVFVAPFQWGNDDLVCAAAIMIGQVLCWQVYGLPSFFKRNARPLEILRKQSKDLLAGRDREYFARVDRLTVALLNNAGVPNTRERYCEYLKRADQRQSDPAVLKSIRQRQQEVLKPE